MLADCGSASFLVSAVLLARTAASASSILRSSSAALTVAPRFSWALRQGRPGVALLTLPLPAEVLAPTPRALRSRLLGHHIDSRVGPLNGLGRRLRET